jgi:hypothetical protein
MLALTRGTGTRSLQPRHIVLLPSAALHATRCHADAGQKFDPTTEPHLSWFELAFGA